MTLDFSIHSQGKSRYPSPLGLSKKDDDFIANYVDDRNRIILNIETRSPENKIDADPKHLLERAGPREQIFFDPVAVRAGIVTCGGLCPGLNDVIRAVVMCLWYRYGTRSITGFRFGYAGLLPEFGYMPLELNPEIVAEIHRDGGTLLGSSRGNGKRTPEIVDTLQERGINILFVIGGDGSQRGALAISREARKRRYPLSVVGVPKTIDNDLSFVQRSFGFDTAVSEAVKAVYGAHVEAHDAPRGIGIVRVMGRESGFIAVHTALAINDVNYVLIPEVPFELGGPNGLFRNLETRLQRRNHAVVLVAEGAGQALLQQGGEKDADASGNRKLGNIGTYLKDHISRYFESLQAPVSIKYIDPSYIIRSAPANPSDSLYCARLGNNAVHAAMAGKTEMLISQVNNHFVHVPIECAVSQRNRVDPESSLWRDVIDATGQPPLLCDR